MKNSYDATLVHCIETDQGGDFPFYVTSMKETPLKGDLTRIYLALDDSESILSG